MEKVEKWYYKNKDIIFIASLLFIFIFIYILNYYTIFAADDYTFYNTIWGNNIKFSFSHILSKTVTFYLTWTGRFVSSYINYFLLAFDRNIFNILNSIVFTGFIYILYRFIKKDKEKDPLLLLTVFFFVWIFIPQFGEVMLWKIGSVIYLWTLTSIVGLALIFKNLFYAKKQKEVNWLSMVALFIFAIIAGNGFETSSLMMIVFVTLLLFYKRIIRKARLFIYELIAYGGLIIGFLSNFLSPGNAVRMGTMGSNESLIDRIISGFWLFYYRGIVSSKIYLLIVLLIIFYIIYLLLIQNNIKAYANKYVIILIISSLSFALILLVSSIYFQNLSLVEFMNWFYGNLKPFMIIEATLLALLLFMIIFGYLHRNKIFINIDRKMNEVIIPLIIASIIGICSYLITPNAWPRSYMGMSTFLIISFCYLIKQISSTLKILFDKSYYIITGTIICCFYVFLFTSGQAIIDMKASTEWNKKTENYIYKQIKSKKKYIIVETFMSTNQYNVASVEKWVIPALIDDKEYATQAGVHKYYEWINIAVTNYYYNDTNAWNSGKRIIGYEKKMEVKKNGTSNSQSL